MKLLILIILLVGSMANNKLLDLLLDLTLEEEISDRSYYKNDDGRGKFIPFGTKFTGMTKPSGHHYGQSEEEEEVSANGEPSFFVKNKLGTSVFVTFACDRRTVKSETTEITAKIEGSYGGVEGSLEGSYKTEREFEDAFVTKTGYTKVGPGGFLEEGVAGSCDMVYATMFVRRRNGKVVPFMNTSGIHKGKVVILSGNPDNIKIAKSFEACGGSGCGCWNSKCWTNCAMGWCYGTESYSQSFQYKRCSSNSQCTPGLSCAGSCTV